MFRILTAAAVLLAASAAHAAPSPESIVQIRVAYSDLDVAAPSGARALMARIAYAAAVVCGRHPDSVMYDDRIRFERCRTDAYGQAVKQLDPAIITAVADYPSRTELGAQ